jgi:hypothetical protein
MDILASEHNPPGAVCWIGIIMLIEPDQPCSMDPVTLMSHYADQPNYHVCHLIRVTSFQLASSQLVIIADMILCFDYIDDPL